MDEILNPIAEREMPDSGLYCIPSDAKNYPNSHFYCIDENCNDPQRRLFLKRSKLGRYFYSHYGNYQHEISPETLLHKLTIKSFEGLMEFELPSFKDDEGNYYPTQIFFIDPDRTVMEFRELQGIRPDVTITSLGGTQLAIEIFVTNRTKDKKIQRLEDHKLPTIEINLNDFYQTNRERCKTDIIFIKENSPVLVAELKRKNWLAKPKVDQIVDLIKGEEPVPKSSPSTTSSPGQGCLLLLVLPSAILVILQLL
jgi:hypothetical protein